MITIIILIILAAISINLLSGENGIIAKTQEASRVSDIEEYKEKIELLKADLLIEHLGGEFSIEELKQKILDTDTVPGGTIEISDDGISANVTTKEGNQFVITATAKSISTKTQYEPGVYDANGVMLASWDELVNTYDLDIEKNYTNDEETTSAYYILTNNYPTATKLVIPDSVITIGENAFMGCTSLTSIEIPNSVISIGSGAFSYCTGLTSMEIPSSVTSIGGMAFVICTGLTNIKVDENNSVYDSRENCNAIIETATNKLIQGCVNTIITDSVTSIGDCAFAWCIGLTNIEIPDNVTSIGGYAFAGCTSLTSIKIPDNVKFDKVTLEGAEVGDYGPGYSNSTGSTIQVYGTFWSCTGLSSIDIPDNLIIDYTYMFGNTSIIEFTIPEGVETIGYYAFAETKLKTIELPSTVKEIQTYAFYYCEDLTSVTYNGITYTSLSALKLALSDNGVTYGYSSFDGSGLAD